MEERIKELSGLINRLCAILAKTIEKPALKEGLNERELMKIHQFVARVAEHWDNFKNYLKSHPETSRLPWSKDFITAVMKLKKTMKDFDEVGMTATEIRLKRKFFRQSFLCDRLITIYERILTGERKPVNDREQRLLNNIKDRVINDIRSTKCDTIFGDTNRWVDGTINAETQILTCIISIQKV